MSLATRCTACGTVFRVVQDQLKVSEGWVRCGRCNQVFNALEGLFDLDRDAPPDWTATVTLPPGATESAAGTPDPAPAASGSARDSGDPQRDKIDAQLMGARESHQDFTPATRISERDRLEFPDAQFDPDMLADDGAAPAPVADAPASTDAADDDAAGRPVTPDFIQRARRDARWRSPGMRALAASVVFAMLAALGLQVAHQFRDSIAARWPDAAPTLAAWCAAMACTIEAPRRIEDVAVESTALTRSATADAFGLSVVLRNRGTVTVALPSVDLSLTDAGGQLVARRVLTPRDFRAASTLIRSGGESALQSQLTVAGAQVAGYTVEVFYP